MPATSLKLLIPGLNQLRVRLVPGTHDVTGSLAVSALLASSQPGSALWYKKAPESSEIQEKPQGRVCCPPGQFAVVAGQVAAEGTILMGHTWVARPCGGGGWTLPKPHGHGGLL